MKITAIKQQVKNSNRANIFLDGKYSFSLSLDQLVEERLKIGQDLDDASLKILKKKSDDGKLRARSIEWLMSRPRSEKEYRTYLYKKNVSKEQIDFFVDEMVLKKYLSDEVFCRWFMGVKARQLKSNKELRYLLRQKGIRSSIINDFIEQTDSDEGQRLKDLVSSKRKNSRYKDDAKLLAYLVRKGYSFSEVKEALAEG